MNKVFIYNKYKYKKMGCNNTPAVEENPLNNSNSGINPNLDDESQFKDFEEIGSKYRNN